jgi:hypothetical protein
VGKTGFGLEGGERGDVDDRASTLRLHDRSDEPRGADHVEEVDVHAGVPLLIGELEHGRARTVGSAVDESIDAAPARHRAVDEALEVVFRLIGTGDPEAAELGSQRLPLARGGQHGNVEAVCGKAPRGAGTDATSAGCDDRNPTLAHNARNDRGGHGTTEATEPTVLEIRIACPYGVTACDVRHVCSVRADTARVPRRP